MKTHVRGHGIALSASAESLHAQRLRLTIGSRTREIEDVELLFHASARNGATEVGCRVRVRCGDGQVLTIEEFGEDARSAEELALWRLSHRLARRELGRSPGEGR